jgi:uncharacterized protein
LRPVLDALGRHQHAAMPPVDTPTPDAPARPRIGALDVLRGFALCGILVVNVRPIAAAGGFLPPSADGGPAGPDAWIGLLTEQRFFPIFSLLFGIGFSLLFESASGRVARPRLVLLRRLLVLLAIGLAHLLLLWRGDVLTTYAVAGLLVLLPSTWLPRAAVAVAGGALLVASLALYGGGTTLVPGLFLLGSALVRYGVVDRLEARGRVPAALAVAFAGLAVPAVRWQLSPRAGGLIGVSSGLPLAVAGLLLAGVYVCVLLVLLRTPLRGLLHAVFAPLGRMALTNYLSATVCVLAVSRVLGRPERWPAATVLAVAATILCVQWIWSTRWLRSHRYGPLEWLWRWATWGRRPLRST